MNGTDIHTYFFPLREQTFQMIQKLGQNQQHPGELMHACSIVSIMSTRRPVQWQTVTRIQEEVFSIQTVERNILTDRIELFPAGIFLKTKSSGWTSTAKHRQQNCTSITKVFFCYCIFLHTLRPHNCPLLGLEVKNSVRLSDISVQNSAYQ